MRSLRLLIALLGMVALISPVSATAAVVINEVDYDQPSTDTAEFIELFNSGMDAVDLTGWTLELVNGNGDAIYLVIDLVGSIPAGGFYVICANATTTINCDLDVSPDTNLIQNGAPDAMGLRDAAGTLVDALSYEGDVAPPYVEGSGTGLEDLFGDFIGISRFPDGADTDVNNADFINACITPGTSNLSDAVDCQLPVAVGSESWGTVKGRFGD